MNQSTEQGEPSGKINRNNVFVGGLSVNCDDAQLRQYLERFGPVDHCNVIKDVRSDISKGYAFASFVKTEDKMKAIGKSHVLLGKVFEVRDQLDPSKNSELIEQIAKRKIHISNLRESIKEKDLLEFFSAYGPVEDVLISRDAKTQLSRNFGFVVFKSIDSMNNCMTQNPKKTIKINNHELTINEAIPKKDMKLKGDNRSSPSKCDEHDMRFQMELGKLPLIPLDQSQFYLQHGYDQSMYNNFLQMIHSSNNTSINLHKSYNSDCPTPSTYYNSTPSPYKPNLDVPSSKFTFTPEVSPVTYVHHPQFTFNNVSSSQRDHAFVNTSDSIPNSYQETSELHERICAGGDVEVSQKINEEVRESTAEPIEAFSTLSQRICLCAPERKEYNSFFDYLKDKSCHCNHGSLSNSAKMEKQPIERARFEADTTGRDIINVNYNFLPGLKVSSNKFNLLSMRKQSFDQELLSHNPKASKCNNLRIDQVARSSLELYESL